MNCHIIVPFIKNTHLEVVKPTKRWCSKGTPTSYSCALILTTLHICNLERISLNEEVAGGAIGVLILATPVAPLFHLLVVLLGAGAVSGRLVAVGGRLVVVIQAAQIRIPTEDQPPKRVVGIFPLIVGLRHLKILFPSREAHTTWTLVCEFVVVPCHP